MRKCPSRSKKENEEKLEFPVAADFVSHPPRIDLKAMLERIAETMSQRKKRPGEDAQRGGEIPVEFVL